jgi:hypothetical protein
MCIQDISQIISSIAITVASLVAIRGINAWKREFRGKRDMELAEDVLCLFYRAERAIEAIRNPSYNLAQGQSREPEKNETPEQKQARDRAYVVFKKIMEHGDIFDELHKFRFRFMARFGKEKAKPFDELKRIVDEIWVLAQQLAELWERQFSQGNLIDADQNLKKEYEGVIWSGWGADTIKPRVDKIIQDIEKVCRQIIEGKGSRWIGALRGLTDGLLEHIKKSKK